MNMFVSNTKHSFSLFLLLISIALFSSSVQSMRFDLPSTKGNNVRCFSEEIKKNSMVVGNYSIVNPNEALPLPSNHTITVQVSTHGGMAKYHLAERIQAGKFAFMAYQTGDYIICFVDTTKDPQVTLSIDFEFRVGMEAVDRFNIAKKSHVDRMAQEVQIMYEMALSIKEEMTYLLERNTEMLDLNYITDNRMFLLIFVSFFVCFSVAGLQLWHLKTFFQKNKLL
ncbi:transmembrane emp24 domain-containing protein p24delta7-like [Vicia villosa]|uniref:transmembrane emp24 domain-containing protein p24delta7-like n=1 Tax=Vicia villosa TaxID=3911 RepID=UPI00273BC8D1|nr:transmembrane emp24 domain-containing protein p24delta7-like [Vicia villosa]